MTTIPEQIIDDLAQSMCGSSDSSEWPSFRDDARAMVATIERAGYAVVPKREREQRDAWPIKERDEVRAKVFRDHGKGASYIMFPWGEEWRSPRSKDPA